MLTLSVATGEEIVRNINKHIEEEKKLFFTTSGNNYNNPPPPSVASSMQLMAAIETRQVHMTQRAQHMTIQKLHSFFDEAPATCIELENNSVVVVGAICFFPYLLSMSIYLYHQNKWLFSTMVSNMYRLAEVVPVGNQSMRLLSKNTRNYTNEFRTTYATTASPHEINELSIILRP